MNLDISGTIDSLTDEIKEVKEATQEKVGEFHEKYLSKVLPDCGKYGDAAAFAAELAPGVSEYNAIREGDWKAFAIAGGVDIAAIGVGAFTAGAGYAVVKGGSAVAKSGVKVAVKEVTEAATKKLAKEMTEKSTEKITKEVIETGAEKVSREVTEKSIEKTSKEVAEESSEKAIKETSEESTEGPVREGAEKLDDSVDQIVQNKLDGTAREVKVLKDLSSEYGGKNVICEAYIRDANGDIIRDSVTGEARRLDFVVRDEDKIIKSIEVTSETAAKEAQMAKEARILEQAKESGGPFIKDSESGKLLPFNASTEIWRLK